MNVNTIADAATSVAAFVGWASRGPIDRAALVQSFTGFQNQFGGLDSRSYLGYAVGQFFANGGQQAYIVRLLDGTTAKAATVHVGTLHLRARNPGAWGNSLSLTVAVQGVDAFNLTVRLGGTVVESFQNLSISPSDSQYVVSVINSQSEFITFVTPGNPAMPNTTIAPVPFVGGSDGTVLIPGDGKFEMALSASPALKGIGDFNILCIPGETDTAAIATLENFCFGKRALLIVDCPKTVTTGGLSNNGALGTKAGTLTALAGQHPENAAYYFPWVNAPDPLTSNSSRLFPPCGFVAGIYASTDASRGVWKSPAGTGATLTGVTGLQYEVTDAENGLLDAKAVNTLRQFPTYGNVVWGARTLQGSDQTASEWKYVPVRRLALFLESSLYAGTKWVVFEPNNETLWSEIRLCVGGFLQNLFRQGAFQGTTAQQAYFVKCDAENNPQASINQGVINITVGFAPLYPAEFVVIQIQQLSSQSQP